MKITCGSCAAKYTVSDEKVQGKTVKVKCRKCGAVIVVSSTGEVQTTGGTPSGAPSAASGDVQYTVSVSDTDQRNMAMTDIVSAYNEGMIDAETYVWAEGMDEWQPLKDVDDIVDALHDAAAVADAADQSQPQDFGSTVALSDAPSDYGSGAGEAVQATVPQAPAESPSVGAGPVPLASSPYDAAPAPAAPSGGDGGFFSMGSSAGASSPAATASAPADAGASGGLFGSASSPGPAVGGGEENSAIFSLNMLTAKVGAPPPSTAAPVATTTEDSGLIDLKALAAGMGGEGEGAAAEAAPAAGGVFPLGAPPPQVQPVGSLVPSMVPPAQGGSRGVIIGLGAAVAVLAAALIFFIVRGDSETAATGPGASGEPTTTAPLPTTTAVVAVAPTSEPSADASAAASASASAAPKVAARYTPGAKRPPGSTPPKSPGATPKKPSKPAAPARGKCGCKADDLMCHMRCSQKK